MDVSLVTKRCTGVGTSQAGCRTAVLMRPTVGEMEFSGRLAFRI